MKFTFRDATLKDEKILFDWRNDSEVRRWSFNNKIINYSEHQKYLKEKISDENYKIWIFLFNDNPCGLVRLSFERDKVFLSYLISKNYRGKKLSSVMLKLAINKICNQFHNINIFAHTKPENKTSIKSLLRAGFISNGMDENKKIYMHKCA